MLGTFGKPAIEHVNGLDKQRAREHERELRQRLQDDVDRIQELLGSRYTANLASPRAGNCVLVARKGKTGLNNVFVAKLCPDWDKEKFLVTWNGDPRNDVEADVNAVVAKVKP